MNAAVCDDSAIDRDLIFYLLKRYADEHLLDIAIAEYETGTGLLYEIEDGACFDAVFLDIYLGDMLGIDLARQLRELRYHRSIIFTTCTSEFAVDGYDVSAAGYLLKPYDYQKLCVIMDRIVQKPNYEYTIRMRSQIINIPYSEILYTESCNARCLLHRSNGEIYTIYKKLDTIEEELNDRRFLRCHKSYLVNMDYIQQADKQFLLKTGDIVAIRQRDLKRMRNAYLSYVSKAEHNS